MIAQDRGRLWARLLVAAAAVGAAAAGPALAQQGRTKARTTPAPAAAAKASATRAQDQPAFREARQLVNPSDPAALVNGEAITRQQLADECIARKGEEILEALIARRLIDQAMRKNRVEVTGAEVDAEINRVAQVMAGVTREQWLATLAKERHISPAQYSRDIIYPSLALRKLAAPRVVVTDVDMKEAMESMLGDKLHCRILMVDSEQKAITLWEELKKNPGSWEKLVQDHSIDQATRAVGGMLSQPIPRHAEPRKVTDAAFEQLVDPDPTLTTKDPVERDKHRPKNGAFTGPIQVEKNAWVILRRESLDPAQPATKPKADLMKDLKSQIFEAKVQVEIGYVMNELVRASAIENKLTGSLKLANEENQPESVVDGEVKLMSNPNRAVPRREAAAEAAPGRTKLEPPPGISSQDLKDAERLKK